MLSRYESSTGAALQRLIAGGTQVRTFPVEVMRHFEVAMDELHEVNRAGGNAQNGAPGEIFLAL